MAEFTGERVVPGEVDPDLWNEHVARYEFAARLAAGRRVLDAGCGTGYGSAMLAGKAASVAGIDVSAEAVRYAKTQYDSPKLSFLQASCAALPFASASFDLVVAFEVIEHLDGWREFLEEARRALVAGGDFVVSTPNLRYYAESRKLTGPNPFHIHEFEFEEFSDQLRRLFPHVSVFVQNHVEAIAFGPEDQAGDFDLRVAGSRGEPSDAHFFVAVCSADAQRGVPGFLFVPGTGNVLRERELHIDMLEIELASKNQWLADLREEKQKLVEMFRSLKQELERSNQWARDLDEKLRAAQARIVELQEEVERTTAGYEARVGELDAELTARAQWAGRIQADLDAKSRELADCVGLLDRAEKTVEERTAWGLRLQSELEAASARLEMVRASRWVRLGRMAGLGPPLENR